MSIMASKTVKQLIMVGNREYPCKGLSGSQSHHSSANRLMSTKKRHCVVFAPQLYLDNYLHECCLGAVKLLLM